MRKSSWKARLEQQKAGRGEWHAFMKRYVWDDDKTPYLVDAGKLNRGQARSELFVYALFFGILFFSTSIWVGSPRAPQGPSAAMSLYFFSVTCAALVLGFTRARAAAWWCAAAPLGLTGYLFASGYLSTLGPVGQFAVVVVLLALLRYGWRVIAIARHYPELEDPPPENG